VKRDRRTPLITDAQPSQDDQLHYREVRYVLMMGVRALCLVVAAVLVSVHAPLLWVWIPLCVAGMVVIPWLAVIMANDRRPQARFRQPKRRPPAEASPPALSGRDPDRTIDAEP
jgi:Flp pilus assembly protein TadB